MSNKNTGAMTATKTAVPKLRITIAAVIEYEAVPAHYPEGSTPEQMLAVDLKSADNDPFSYLGGSVTEWKTTGEVVGAPAAASGAGTPDEPGSLPADPGTTGEQDMASPEYRAGWNDAMDIMTKSMLRVETRAALAAAPAAAPVPKSILDELGLPAGASEQDVRVAIEDLKAAVHDAEEAAPQAPAAAQPVAEVLWFDPELYPEQPKTGHKIIDASIAWMESAPIGTKLYAAPQAPAAAQAQPQQLTPQQIDELRDLLTEAHRFAGMSPRGRENIGAALEILDSGAAGATGEQP